AFTGDILNSSNVLGVGAVLNGSSVDNVFNGSIDEVKIFNYSKSADEINASAKGFWNDIPETYPNATNITGFIRLGDLSASINLTRNGTRVSNSSANFLTDALYLAAGIYQYNITYWATQNYTDYNISKILNLNKGAGSNITVTFNTSSGFAYGDPLAVWANITSRLGDQSATVVLLRNSTEVSRAAGNVSSNITLPAGIYNFSAYYSESQNWTNATATNSYFTIQRATPILGVQTNNSFQAASGLVGYWSFDENTTQTARDQSGFGNDGTWTGNNNVTRNLTGRFGNALQFDGEVDVVVIGNLPIFEGMGALTIEAWVNYNLDAGNRAIVSKFNSGAGGTSYTIRSKEGNPGFIDFTTFTGGGVNSLSTTQLNNSAWHHIAGTYDGSNQRLYIDGVLQDTDAQSGNIQTSNELLCIGAFCDPSQAQPIGNSFNGTIDEVRIYNYSKSASEINASAKGVWMDIPETYPNATNVTGFVRLGDSSAAVNLTRNGTRVSNGTTNTILNDTILLAAGIYQYNVTYWETQNYTAYNVSKILTIPQGSPSLSLFLNGTQADVSSYVYNNPTNATAFRTTILYNNEGTLQLWRNDTSLGTGGPGNLSEILVLPAGIHNYSAILINVANYTYSNVSYVLTIQKATPILGIQMNNSNGSGVNSGNVLYLSFDENTTGRSYDQSGFGNDATWTGGANNATRNLTGRFGNALTFDGVNDLVAVEDSASIKFGSGDFTVSFWVNIGPYHASDYPIFVGKEDEQATRQGWGTFLDNTVSRSLMFEIISGGSIVKVDSATAINDSVWHHVAGQKNSTGISVYIDGIMRASASHSLGSTNKAIPLTIGNRGNVASRALNGTIDEVRIYNYSMSTNEINASAKGVWNDIPLFYHDIVNTSAFVRLGDSSAAVNLTRNGTRISNGTANIAVNESILLAAGIYQYNITYWESQNYSSKNVSKVLNIPKAPTFATLHLNDTNSNRDYNRSDWINVTGYISTPRGFFSFETKLLNLTFNYTRDYSTNWTATGVITGANNTIYNITFNDVPGAYNMTLWFVEDQNYTTSSASQIANVYGNLWVGLINPTTAYYIMQQNITLNVTVQDYLRSDEVPSVNVSMNLTSLYANKFKNVPYYSRNVSMININTGNYSSSYNVTDIHAGNYSLNYTAARSFYRTGRNFTTIYINESINATITSLFVNVSANVTQNQAVLVNGSLDRQGNIEINGTLDIVVRRVNPDNVGLIVANSSSLDVYESEYNRTLVAAGYNVTIIDDDTVNAGTWTPSVYNLILWGEASYDNFFMQYIDNNIWGQVTGGKPLLMMYYGMIKGAVDLNLSTTWGGRFQRDVNVKTVHAITDNYTATNVSEIQDTTYNSLYLFDFKGTELADDGTSGRTVIGINTTQGARVVVYGPYRATYWTSEAKDMFLRSVYWAIYGSEQTTFTQTQNITVPYTVEDHFNESDGTAEGWNATIGSWIVQNGVYIQTSNASSDTGAITKLNNNSYWNDYTVSLRFNMLGGVANNTQAYLRYDGATRYYLLNISSNGAFAFYKNTGSGATNITDASPNLISISQDTWYTMNITVRENRLEAEIGGLGRINTTDASSIIQGGTIALGTERSSSRFDDVAIYHHDGGNKGGRYYFKREWAVGRQAPGTYRATATFTYYNHTGNRTIASQFVEFNVTSNLTAAINVSLNATLLSFKSILNITGNVTAGGNLEVVGNFTLSVWNNTYEMTNLENRSRTVDATTPYIFRYTWDTLFNRSGNYSVRVNFTWPGGSTYERANFSISFNVTAEANITVEAPKYNASRNVTVNVTVENKVSVEITNAQISCGIVDPNNALVASAFTNPDISNRSIGSIPANAVRFNFTQWNVTVSNAGTYTVRCNVTDNNGLIGHDTETFDITRINATISLNANRTSANYTVNDVVGIEGNITAVGGINVTGRLVVEVHNASQRIEQVYSSNVITAGKDSLNITALNLTFRTYKNLTGTYTLNATFNYTNETGSQIVRNATTQFNISSRTNATISISSNVATYATTETATVTTVVTSTANQAITDGNLTIRIFNSTVFNATYRYYWNSSLYNITPGGSITRSDLVNLSDFRAGTQYMFANFTFGSQNVNVTSTFTISVIVPTTNLTVRFFIEDNVSHMVYTTISGEIPANKTNASSEWNARWIVSFFNDSVIGLYGTGGGVSVGASNSTMEHRINVNGLIRESRIYAIVTKGTRQSFQNRAELLDRGTFTTQVNPSFGYPLRDKNLLSLKLKYSDIDVQGSETLRKGTYNLRIENNGTSGGKTLIHIKTI
ncbi:MAG: laminin G domain-containing protein, partial [Candidatus Aenigmarchaeota archaeon]|nr:laminin G domain-containing protein [Candidatus Aenigmarchaeota archaeon]